jgi:hypothetical protein
MKNLHLLKPTPEDRAARFEQLYFPAAEKPSKWLWALDLAGGILWIFTVGLSIAFLVAVFGP